MYNNKQNAFFCIFLMSLFFFQKSPMTHQILISVIVLYLTISLSHGVPRGNARVDPSEYWIQSTQSESSNARQPRFYFLVRIN